MVGGKPLFSQRRLRIKTQARTMKPFCLKPLVWFHSIWPHSPFLVHFRRICFNPCLSLLLSCNSRIRPTRKSKDCPLIHPYCTSLVSKESLEKATTLTRKCANVCLLLHNRSIKILILKNITQMLKRSGLTSNSIGSNSGNMQAIWGLLH